MKSLFYCLILCLIFSCGNKKTVQLPEITHSKITEIHDVSPAYLFYDETMPDSVELNRKNLISTTNWLVNVDKRLTLGQALPKIMFLQNKKRNAELHKNENAKNYFTCNDTSIKNLGFIDFTNTFYHEDNSSEYLDEIKTKAKQLINVKVNSLDSTSVSYIWSDTVFIHTSNQKEFLNHLTSNLTDNGKAIIVSEFNKSLSFQDYITYKSMLERLDLKNVTIAHDEFVFN